MKVEISAFLSKAQNIFELSERGETSAALHQFEFFVKTHPVLKKSDNRVYCDEMVVKITWALANKLAKQGSNFAALQVLVAGSVRLGEQADARINIYADLAFSLVNAVCACQVDNLSKQDERDQYFKAAVQARTMLRYLFNRHNFALKQLPEKVPVCGMYLDNVDEVALIRSFCAKILKAWATIAQAVPPKEKIDIAFASYAKQQLGNDLEEVSAFPDIIAEIEFTKEVVRSVQRQVVFTAWFARRNVIDISDADHDRVQLIRNSPSA